MSKFEITQESTPGEGRVDSRPETRFFTEGLQKEFFFRSRLSEVTSRLGVGLTASTASFLDFSSWVNGLQRLVSLLQRSTTAILTSKRIKWSVDQFKKVKWLKVIKRRRKKWELSRESSFQEIKHSRDHTCFKVSVSCTIKEDIKATSKSIHSYQKESRKRASKSTQPQLNLEHSKSVVNSELIVWVLVSRGWNV